MGAWSKNPSAGEFSQFGGSVDWRRNKAAARATFRGSAGTIGAWEVGTMSDACRPAAALEGVQVARGRPSFRFSNLFRAESDELVVGSDHLESFRRTGNRR